MDSIRCPFCNADIQPLPSKLDQCRNTYILAWKYECSCRDYCRTVPNMEDRRWFCEFTSRSFGETPSDS